MDCRMIVNGKLNARVEAIVYIAVTFLLSVFLVSLAVDYFQFGILDRMKVTAVLLGLVINQMNFDIHCLTVKVKALESTERK